MSADEHAPLRTYEVTWLTGHVETIQASQVTWPNNTAGLFGGDTKPPFIRFHGHIDGHWTLVLQAREDDIRAVRDVTSGEVLS